MKTPPVQRAASRRKLAAKGQALSDGTDPIPNLDYLKRAIRSKGRVDPAKWPALKALIRKRARELKATNAPGVKGTWAFSNADAQAAWMRDYITGSTEALEMAMPARRMPLVRGAADIQASRSGPGKVAVMHRSTGMKVGHIEPADGGYQPVHASGAKPPVSATIPGAMAGLIRMHNDLARKKAGAGIASVKGYAGEQEALDLAGAVPVSTPAVSSSDGPRVTSMSGGKKARAMPAMHPAAVAVYRKLRFKGMPHGQALALTKRAMAMHGKAA